MKKFSIAVCVCAVLFSFSNYSECVREVSAQTSGAEENLAILQDIIRENECQAGMAFLGYTYENADTSEILEYTRQEELAAAYPFLQDGTVVDAGGYEIYAIVPGLDCKISIYPTQVTAHPLVHGMHDLIVHDYGPGRLILSLHAEVPAHGDLLIIHDEIDNIEHELQDKLSPGFRLFVSRPRAARVWDRALQKIELSYRHRSRIKASERCSQTDGMSPAVSSPLPE